VLIMADIKYKDSTPVDEPIPKGKVKAVEPGSGIRVDGKPLKAEGYAKPPAERAGRNPAEGFAKPPSSNTETSKTNAMGNNYAKGGMTASSRADGCCVKGKTRGKVC